MKKKSVEQYKRNKRRHSSDKLKSSRKNKSKKTRKKSKKKIHGHRKKSKSTRSSSGWMRDLIMATTIVLVGLLFVFVLCFSINKTEGYSMSPQMEKNDLVLVRKKNQLTIKRFDVIYFKRNAYMQCRRVIGLPGEQIVYDDDILYVNDQPVDEKFLIAEVNQWQRKGKAFTENFRMGDVVNSIEVPEDSYFVLGDNRPYATDSRHYGFVPKDVIKGKAISVLFPVSHMKIL